MDISTFNVLKYCDNGLWHQLKILTTKKYDWNAKGRQEGSLRQQK